MKVLLLLTLASLLLLTRSERLLDSNSTSNTSNASNSSNTSNDSNSSFILIQADSPVSQLSAADLAAWESKWLDWKDSWPRYNSKFDPVSKTYAPQEDYYKNSITALGTPFFLIGGVIMFIGILFVVFRYGLGRCGAKGESSEALLTVTRFKRHCSMITTALALTLWFCGLVVAMHGTVTYGTNLKTTQDSLKAIGQREVDEAQTFKDVSSKINSKNLTYPNDTNQSFTLEFFSSQDILDAANSVRSGANDFSDALGSDYSVFLGFSIVFLLFGFTALFIMILSLLRKLSSFTMIIGVSCILFSAMAFGVTGFYFSQGFKVGDICQQNSQIIEQNYPDSGTGVFYYVPCFSSKSVKYVIQVSNDGMNHMLLAVDFYFSALKNSTFSDYYIKIQHHTDIIALYNNGTFKTNAELTKWGEVITDLDRALYGMENLKECVGPREYSVVSQANFCYNGLPALYNLGFVGTLVQAIAWFLLIFTGIQLKSVLEKMKADSESMIGMRQANYS